MQLLPFSMLMSEIFFFFQQSFSFQGWDEHAWKSGVCVEKAFCGHKILLKSKRNQSVEFGVLSEPLSNKHMN